MQYNIISKGLRARHCRALTGVPHACGEPLPTPSSVRSLITVDLEALTQRDKLELAAELIHNVLQQT
ncbi:MAG: hypothetical protein RM021_028100 [Nostoc sp. EkiNYC01]|nr:hypothetical protein [Nostoc sp. EkiNYC01]